MINYYEIEISGKNIYRFFEKIIKNKINIFDIKHKLNIIIFKVSYNDYLKIIKLNTIYNIRIINIRGINKVKKLFSFYYIFFCLLFLNIVFIFIYSKMIFFIEIKTENKELKEIIESNYDKYELSLYKFSNSYSNLKKISERIKQDNNKLIEWIEIKHIGVKYEINIIEKIDLDSKNINNTKKNDVVAEKNGLILDIYASSGEIIKNKGDYVKKGEIIISGMIKKNDEVKNIVSAQAKVYAEVWYKVIIEHPFIFEEQVNEKGYKNISINIFNKDIVLLSRKNKSINKEQEIILIKNSIFTLKSIQKYQTNLVKKKYTKKELQNILENMAKKEIVKQLSKNEKILLQKTLKNTTDDVKMNIEVFFKVYENIAIEKDIKLDNIEG